MRISLVAAVATNGVIGADGGLAWKISDDLKWFKRVTMGKPIIMGRKTFQSIGRPLPGRSNIVITRSLDFSADGVFIARSITAALTLACEFEAGEVCVIGGGEIYRQTIETADRIYLTRVDASVDGDTHFPEIEPGDWGEKRESVCEKNQRNEHACAFFILDRRTEKRRKC